MTTIAVSSAQSRPVADPIATLECPCEISRWIDFRTQTTQTRGIRPYSCPLHAARRILALFQTWDRVSELARIPPEELESFKRQVIRNLPGDMMYRLFYRRGWIICYAETDQGVPIPRDELPNLAAWLGSSIKEGNPTGRSESGREVRVTRLSSAGPAYLVTRTEPPLDSWETVPDIPSGVTVPPSVEERILARIPKGNWLKFTDAEVAQCWYWYQTLRPWNRARKQGDRAAMQDEEARLRRILSEFARSGSTDVAP